MRMAAYCRVSTEKEEQLSSLENQREFFLRYAEKEGDTITEIYADEGISGRSMKKRGAFLRLLKDAESGAFDYVAVKDISRFARNTSDFLYGIRTLRSNGIDVRFLSGNQTVMGGSEFILTVFAAFAQEESANLSKRVIFGKKQSAKKGSVPNCVYGYDKTDAFTLRINPAESAVVREIFEWYNEGLGGRAIAERLNEADVPTKKNALWTSKTVRRILTNTLYTGRLVNNRSETGDFLTGTRRALPEEEWYTHNRPELRIISDEEFTRAAAMLDERRGIYAGGSFAGRFSAKHIFSNLIVCGECGKSFTARVYRGKDTYVRYRCSAHNNGCCSNSVTVDERALLNAVKKYIADILGDSGCDAGKILEETAFSNEDMRALVEKIAVYPNKTAEIYMN